jgi:hypothetical protein
MRLVTYVFSFSNASFVYASCFFIDGARVTRVLEWGRHVSGSEVLTRAE